MTRQQIIEFYGKSVYQIELEVAAALYCKSDTGDSTQRAKTCLKEAKDFVTALLADSGTV